MFTKYQRKEPLFSDEEIIRQAQAEALVQQGICEGLHEACDLIESNLYASRAEANRIVMLSGFGAERALSIVKTLQEEK